MDIIGNIIAFDIAMPYNPKPNIHRHDNHEFFFCAEGSGTQHLENRILRMKMDDLFLFPEGQPHMGNGSRTGKCTGYVLNVKEEALLMLSDSGPEFAGLLGRLKKAALDGRNRIPLSKSGTRGMRMLLPSLIAEMRDKKPGYRISIISLIQQFLVLLLRESKINFEKASSRTDPGNRIEEFIRFVRGNYMYDINVGNALRMTRLSRSHFHALFRKQTGKTLIRFVNGIRISEATRLIAEDKMPAGKVWRKCGFKSLSNFYHALRQETGKKTDGFTA